MAKQPTRRKTTAGAGGSSDKIIDSALALAAERGWKKLSLMEIAAAADVPITELYQLFGSKSAILAGFSRRTDAIVLAALEADGDQGDESRQDRLFDVLMRRFDALAPYKSGVKAIARDLPADPMALLVTLPQLGRSFSWMLMAAGLRSDGVRGLVRVKMVLALWFATMRVWFGDDDPEHGRTMASLNKNLDRASRWCGWAGRGGPSDKAAAA